MPYSHALALTVTFFLSCSFHVCAQGFLTAVLVEAGTGKGIIMQIIMWLKITGFLGAESGF